MKTRFNKILTVITAVTFAVALTLNIQASLNDPFAGMSDEALAQTTSGVTSETTGGGYHCTASTSCGINPESDYVSCTGVIKCERHSSWVKCDGHRTDC